MRKRLSISRPKHRLSNHTNQRNLERYVISPLTITQTWETMKQIRSTYRRVVTILRCQQSIIIRCEHRASKFCRSVVSIDATLTNWWSNANKITRKDRPPSKMLLMGNVLWTHGSSVLALMRYSDRKALGRIIRLLQRGYQRKPRPRPAIKNQSRQFLRTKQHSSPQKYSK